VGQTYTFRSPTAVVIWVVWLLFAVGNWIDLAVQGRDHTAAVAAAIVLLATGAVYVAAQRPQIIADDAGVTVRNPLRDHRIGWAGVTKIDLADLLRVHCDRKVVHAWAVPYSRRRRLAAEVRARRTSGPRRSTFGLPSGGLPSGGLPSGGGRALPYGATGSGSEASTAEAEAERIVRLLSERATAVQAEAAWAGGTVETTGTTGTRTQAASPAALDASGWFEPLRSTWSGRAIAALVIPALILLIVWLV
jgi:hypothetical protein